MKKTLHWLDENLEEFLLVVMLAAMTLIMGIQIFSRYALGQSLSWSEEVTRFLFIWSGFLSVSYCAKSACLSRSNSSSLPFHAEVKLFLRLSTTPLS